MMRHFKKLFLLALLAVGGQAHAQEWADLATSGSLIDGRMCYTDGKNIVCDATSPIFDSGNVGIASSTPTVALEVSGSILVSNGGETCSGGNFAGAIRYNTSSSDLEFCDGTAWKTMDADGAVSSASIWQAGSGDDIYYVSGTEQVGIGTSSPAVALDVSGSINFTNEIQYGGSTFAKYIADDTDTLAIGTLSAHSAYNNSGSGRNTFVGISAGNAITSGDFNTFLGSETGRDTTTGNSNTFLGNEVGLLNTTGSRNVAVGTYSFYNNDSGSDNVAIGFSSLQQGDGSGSVAVGRWALQNATGGQNTAIGREAGRNITSGSDNIMIGPYTNPSAATDSNKLNIGNTIYGDLSTDYVGIGQPTPTVALEVSGSILVSNGGETCSGGNFAGAIRYNTSSSDVEFCDGSSWNSMDAAGAGGAVFEVASNVVRGISGTVDYATDDFVFGSTQLADTGNADHDSRMFFDKSKGAFRAGIENINRWDDANVGDYSFAAGSYVTAAGTSNIALGTSVNVNALNAFGIGQNLEVTGNGAFALGSQVSATRTHSAAIGLGAPSGAYPVANATNSMGIFLGDQSGASIDTTSTMALVGGHFIVNSPSMDDEGSGKYDNRMFFNKDNGAFRVGTDSWGAWDSGNVGTRSIALGMDSVVTGGQGIAIGGFHYVTGFRSVAIGDSTHVGYNSVGIGKASHALGSNSYTLGYDALASANNGIALGSFVTSGDGEWVGGVSSNGSANPTVGEGSMAIGITMDANEPTNNPLVTGDESLGIFMGNQDGVKLSQANTMAIMGATGGVGIGLVTPTTAMHVSGTLTVGNGAETCSGGNFAGAIRYNTGTSDVEFCDGSSWNSMDATTATASPAGSDSQIQYNDNGTLAATETFIYDSWNNMLRMESRVNNVHLGIFASQYGNYIKGENHNLNIYTIRSQDDILITPGNFSQGLFLKADTGRVDVGEGNPTVALDVSGSINFTNELQLGGNTVMKAFTDDTDSLAVGTQSTHSSYSASGNGGNVFLGPNAGNAITSGDRNTILGADTGTSLADGGGNVLIGNTAGTSLDSGNRNVAIGTYAFSSNTGGFDHVAVGFGTLQLVSGSSGNVAIGRGALQQTTQGGNTAVGYYAGDAITGGFGNIMIGANTDPPNATDSYRLNIGDSIYGDLSNDYIGIGTDAPDVAMDVSGSIEYTGTIQQVSDMRLKTDIQPLESQVDKLMQVEPVSYVMKDNPDKTQFGVIAQQIEEQYPELVKTADDEMGTKSVNYVGMIAPMLKAMQEMRAKIDDLENQVRELKGE